MIDWVILNDLFRSRLCVWDLPFSVSAAKSDSKPQTRVVPAFLHGPGPHQSSDMSICHD